MEEPAYVELYDETRPAWRASGPRPVRSYVWRPSSTNGGPLPLVVLSHGSGGAASDLTWLADSLCAHGFLVAAVDHHGNCTTDSLPEGASFWWERPNDLSVLVDHLERTERLGRVGVVGYSLGGYTAASVLGARIDTAKLNRLYDGEEVLPIPEHRPEIVAELAGLLRTYGRDAVIARATADHTDPRFLAGILLAPAICPILDDQTLAAIRRPVLVRWGDQDTVERPEDNGCRYTRLIPGADGRSMGSEVGHVDFSGEHPPGASVRAAVAAEALALFRAELEPTG